MRPIKNSVTAIPFGAPPGWDAAKHGECKVLYVADANPYFFSYWKPSFRDVVAMIFGATIRLSCVGGQPPVWMGVDPDGLKEVK